MSKAGAMRSVRIVETFTGGPDGRQPFTAGQTVNLPEAEAALYVAKGHAVDASPKPAVSAGAKKDITP